MFFLIPVVVAIIVVFAAILDGCAGRFAGASINESYVAGGAETNQPLPPPMVTIEDITGYLPYDPEAPKIYENHHIGQRKLFLNELQFITREARLNEPALVVYAGGAPSNKIALLAELCPNILFLLVDPNPFNVFPPTYWNKASPYGPDTSLPKTLISATSSGGLTHPRIIQAMKETREVYDGLVDKHRSGSLFAPADPRLRVLLVNTIYTPEHSVALREVFPEEKIYFMSDIRTNIESTLFPGDIDLVWNIAQQYIWSSLLKSESTMMKWKHPWYDDNSSFDVEDIIPMIAADFKIAAEGKYVSESGVEYSIPKIDFVGDFQAKVLRYPVGDVFIQPWAGSKSTETRLVFKRDAPVIQHMPAVDYDAKLFWYNRVGRAGPRKNPAIPKNPRGKLAEKIKDLHIDNCNDCALEAHIWSEYLAARPKEMGQAPSVYSLISSLIAATHGRQLHPPMDELKKAYLAKWRQVAANAQNKTKQSNFKKSSDKHAQ